MRSSLSFDGHKARALTDQLLLWAGESPLTEVTFCLTIQDGRPVSISFEVHRQLPKESVDAEMANMIFDSVQAVDGHAKGIQYGSIKVLVKKGAYDRHYVTWCQKLTGV